MGGCLAPGGGPRCICIHAQHVSLQRCPLTVIEESFDHGVPVVRRLCAERVHRYAAALEGGNLSDVPLLLKQIVGLCQALQPA